MKQDEMTPKEIQEAMRKMYGNPIYAPEFYERLEQEASKDGSESQGRPEHRPTATRGEE